MSHARSWQPIDSKPMTKLYFEVQSYYSLSAVIGDELMLLSTATHQAFTQAIGM